ncbi:MAG: hypothetical protein EG825_00830 [Rhodocyclaceae bacterium]|nr:hypothetical protein [Rhodocyclaceae bacterium]
MSQKDIFADTFNGIAVTGNLVRIDLATLASSAGSQPPTQPQFETHSRLIMPIDGFLRAYALAEDVMKKLIAAGIVNQKSDAAPGLPASAVAATEVPGASVGGKKKPSSPNFD